VTAADLLAGLHRTLDYIADVAALGRERYDADRLVRWAIQRLWITVGNYAEAYHVAADIQAGEQPWSELYGYRSVLAPCFPKRSATSVSGSRPWKAYNASAANSRLPETEFARQIAA
jgi:hypothetical protein